MRKEHYLKDKRSGAVSASINAIISKTPQMLNLSDSSNDIIAISHILVDNLNQIGKYFYFKFPLATPDLYLGVQLSKVQLLNRKFAWG